MAGPSLLVFRQVFALYHAHTQGKEVRLPHSAPSAMHPVAGAGYPARAESFWRATLRGFTEPTPFRIDRPGVERGPAGGFADYEEKSLLLTEKATAALQAFGRQHQLTLNTLVQGAWAILLFVLQRSVSAIRLRTTVSGRSAPLPGIDQDVGVFINTLRSAHRGRPAFSPRRSASPGPAGQARRDPRVRVHPFRRGAGLRRGNRKGIASLREHHRLRELPEIAQWPVSSGGRPEQPVLFLAIPQSDYFQADAGFPILPQPLQ